MALNTDDRPVQGQVKVLNQTIRVQRLQRSKYQIDNWRSALRSAESPYNPIRKRLYEIYNELAIDVHIRALMDKRLRNVRNTPIVYKDKDGTINNDATDLMRKNWFWDLLKHSMDALYWSHSLIELELKKGEVVDVKLIPRQNVRPELGIIGLNTGYDTDGIHYREAPYDRFVIEVDMKDLGLFNIAAANGLYKKYGMIDFSNFVEMFGSPIREYKYDPSIANAKEEMEAAAQQSANSAAIVIPKDYGEVTLHDGNASSNADAHKQFIELLRKELSILILGQTMTTDDGSSRSQAEVHLQEQNQITKEDKLFLKIMLNEQLKKLLLGFGYPIPADGYFDFDDQETMSMKEQAELELAISKQYKIPASYFEEKYGIPVEDKPEPPPVPEFPMPEPGNDDDGGQEAAMAHARLPEYHYLTPQALKVNMWGAFQAFFNAYLNPFAQGQKKVRKPNP